MAKIIAAKINVSKITKEKLFEGEKGTYLDISIAVNDEVNEYGQNVSIYENQTAKERSNEEPRNYLGNGKTVWDSDGNLPESSGEKKSKPGKTGKKGKKLPF